MKFFIGVDEVGRGPLAGPVMVGVVAMSTREYGNMRWRGLTDSKKMSARARQVWYERAQELKKEGKLKVSVTRESAQAIDTRGLSVCIRQCIDRGLKELDINPKDCTILLDGGLRAPDFYERQQTIVRGDAKKKIISLASVIAKVTRDRLMVKLDAQHPQYGWGSNKGYGTLAHRRAIQRYGRTSYHRRTFLRSIDKK